MFFRQKQDKTQGLKMYDLTTLYCSIDDFWQSFKEQWDQHLIENGKGKRGPDPLLSISEMMTIMVMFQQSNYRTFKHFYSYVHQYYSGYFPCLIGYARFVQVMKTLFIPLFAYAFFLRGKVTGIAFIDATSIKVCHNKRISRNKVFKGLAKRGKTTSGWFYGFKLHLIINDKGEILAFQVTPGNVSDVSVVDGLSKGITGKMFGDKGYISSALFQRLFREGLQLITTLRSNMKNKLMSLKNKLLLRKRSIIETVNDQLKNISQIEHTRHRSAANFLINLLSALIAYSHQEKKPSLNLEEYQGYSAITI